MRSEFGIDHCHRSASHLARTDRLLNRLHVALQIFCNPTVALDLGPQHRLRVMVGIDRLVGDDWAHTVIRSRIPFPSRSSPTSLGRCRASPPDRPMPALVRQLAFREVRPDVAMPCLAVITDARSRYCPLPIGHDARAPERWHPLNGQAAAMIAKCSAAAFAHYRLVRCSGCDVHDGPVLFSPHHCAHRHLTGCLAGRVPGIMGRVER